MDSDLEKQMRELLDKQAIREGVLKYSRACDRVDEELMASVFHEDAYYNHYQFTGSGGPKAIAKAVCSQLGAPAIIGMSHFVPQTLIELDGDVAFAETYGLTCLIRVADGQERTYFRGIRLLDRWERRDGKTWKIAYRTVRHDGFERDEPAASMGPPPNDYKGQRGRGDTSYHMRTELKVK